MAEPQPPGVTEGMEESAPPPASAEDRKTAAAMDALESSRTVDEENQKATKQVDVNAISQAISRLEVATEVGKGAVEDPNEERRKKTEHEKREKERRAKIKVDPADVNLFVEECDMSKAKATELLRAHERNFEDALRGYLRAWI